MKSLKYVLLFAMMVAVSTFVACKDKKVTVPPTTSEKLAGTYKVTAATKDGLNVLPAYSTFTMTLAKGGAEDGTYTIVPSTEAKPNYNSANSGTYKLLNTRTKMEFAGVSPATDVAISNLETKPVLKFTWTMPATLDKTEPAYIVTVTKQ